MRTLLLLFLSHLVCVSAISLQYIGVNNITDMAKNNTKKPRVFVVVVQTHATQGWCMLIVSAKLSHIEIITVAMGGLYSHVRRPKWVMEFLEKQNASDEDIVIHSDGSDVIVTDGQKYENAVEYFIQNTAENKEKFSGEDIVKENQISPIQFITTADCTAPQLDFIVFLDHKEHTERCRWFFEMASKTEKEKGLPPLLKFPDTGKPYLWGGNLIARVWAFKRFKAAFDEVLAVADEWWSEQSIYIPLLLWSVKQEEKVSTRFVLPRGLIGLDYKERFFSVPYETYLGKAAFLHFPGHALAWEAKARKIIANLTWYKEWQGKKLNTKGLGQIQAYAVSGEKLNLDYDKVFCDAFKQGDLFKANKL